MSYVLHNKNTARFEPMTGSSGNHQVRQPAVSPSTTLLLRLQQPASAHDAAAKKVPQPAPAAAAQAANLCITDRVVDQTLAVEHNHRGTRTMPQAASTMSRCQCCPAAAALQRTSRHDQLPALLLSTA